MKPGVDSTAQVELVQPQKQVTRRDQCRLDPGDELADGLIIHLGQLRPGPPAIDPLVSILHFVQNTPVLRVKNANGHRFGLQGCQETQPVVDVGLVQRQRPLSGERWIRTLRPGARKNCHNPADRKFPKRLILTTIKTCPIRLPWWGAASDGSLVQKSAAVALAGCCCSSTRSGQSAAVMSQKRHSCRLGTRLAGSAAERRRINLPRFWMNSSSTASAGMRTVWSR